MLPYFRYFGKHIFKFTLFIDPFLIMLLIYFSRYPMNNVFMMLYMSVIYELVHVQTYPYNILQTVVMALNILFTYQLALQYGVHYNLLSQLFFLTMVFILFGVLLIFIRSTREVRDEVQEANQKLEHAILELEAANLEVERLVRINERSQVSKNLHDTVGHEMTGLIMEIEMLKIACTDPVTQSKLEDTADHARHALVTLRELVDVYRPIQDEATLVKMLHKRIETFISQTGIQVSIHHELGREVCSMVVNEAIYRTTIEALTNVAKHSDATEVWISIQLINKQRVMLKVIDNGKGAKPVVMGNGLKFIEERVKQLGGDLRIRAEASGFELIATLGCEQCGGSI